MVVVVIEGKGKERTMKEFGGDVMKKGGEEGGGRE